ncbi:MAG: FtsX-like permease family protein [Nitrospirae bacterium]|nr:FtsX-like permease family protein [Nitrospirota bacterium]MCL5236714.1 FtsX-like permease family protein [Nitrospirota bacterium]
MTKEFTLLSLAVRNLKRKPLRTVILAVAIGLLVTALVFALSFIRRVDSSIKMTSDRLGADLLIVPTGSRGAAEDVLLENKAKSFYMDKGVIEKIRKVKGIDKMTYQTYLVTLSGLCCDVPESVVVAFNQDTDFVIKPWLTKKLGRRLRKGEAIVGSESAFNISVGLVDVDSVLFGNVFKMVGVLDKTGTGLDTALFIDESNIDDIIRKGKSSIQPGQISVVFAKVKKGLDPYKVAGEIEDSVIEVDTIARKDIGKNIINALRDINQIFAVTVTLASVLAAFLAWAVFSAIANERSREVGIMRAIGAKESHIVKLFILEVFIIGSLGSVLGIISGTALSLALAKSFTILKNISTDLGIVERSLIALSGLAIGTGVCIIGALSPVRKVKRLEPLVVIKGE